MKHENLSKQEILLRLYGGCSTCNITPFAAPGRWGSGWMCEHATSLTQVDITRLGKPDDDGE